MELMFVDLFVVAFRKLEERERYGNERTLL
jgi:hypothetical protein